MPPILNWIALVLAISTSIGMLVSRDWRWSLGFLAIQYLGVFWLVQAHFSISMAAAKLVTGWMACAVIGLARRNIPFGEETASGPQGLLFQFLSTAIVLTVTFSISQGVTSWLRFDLPIAWASLALMGLGLLHLGFTSNSFKVVISLLSIMAGFEILYAGVENSILVTALLALVNLGLALAGAYFLVMGAKEEA